jgi:hypothetical protein
MINMPIVMNEDQKYIEYVAKFDEKVKSGDIFEEDGAFYEKTPGGRKRLVGRKTYSDWLPEMLREFSFWRISSDNGLCNEGNLAC